MECLLSRCRRWTLIIFFFACLLPAAAYAAEQRPSILIDELIPCCNCLDGRFYQEISSFSELPPAQQLYTILTESDEEKNNYRLCSEIDKEGVYRYKIMGLGSIVTTQEEKSRATEKRQEAHITADVFERKRRAFHPFLAVTGTFNDNIYNTKKHKTGDVSFTVSPGFWLSFPSTRKRLHMPDYSVLSPGGLLTEEYGSEAYRRIFAYLSYQADFIFFSKDSTENRVDHTAYALVGIRFGDFTFTVDNGFSYSQDDRGMDVAASIDRHWMNTLRATALIETGRKTRVLLSFADVRVNYRDDDSSFRDRNDQIISGEFHYRLAPKTTMFTEYRFIDINYDKSGAPSSREHHFLGGLQWDATAKTTGVLRAGYALKDFKDSGRDRGDFMLEINVDYRPTAKTALSLKGWRKDLESDIDTASSMLSYGASARLQTLLTSKVTGYLHAGVTVDRYRDDSIDDNRRDTRYEGGIGLSYAFKRWLSADLGYTHYALDSSVQGNDYASNVFYFRLRFAL